METLDALERRNALIPLETAEDNLETLYLIEEALKDTHPTVRASAVWTLGRIRGRTGSSKALELIMRASSDPDPFVRLEVSIQLEYAEICTRKDEPTLTRSTTKRSIKRREESNDEFDI